MEVNPPLNLQARNDHTAVGDRQLIASISPTSNVMLAAHLAVTQNGTPNMSVNVAAGKAIVHGTEAAPLQGAYHVWNDATKNLTIASADAVNKRIDLVVCRVRDAAYSGSTNAWALEVVTGTPAASPVAPALPANSYALASIEVAALASSITNAVITDLRTLNRPWNVAWGYVNGATSPAGAPAATSAVLWTGTTASVSLIAGRRYRLRVGGGVATSTTASRAKLAVRNTLGTELVATLTVIPSSLAVVVPANELVFSQVSSATNAYSLYVETAGGGGSSTWSSGYWSLDDIGPA